jgi:hypothetical protein
VHEEEDDVLRLCGVLGRSGVGQLSFEVVLQQGRERDTAEAGGGVAQHSASREPGGRWHERAPPRQVCDWRCLFFLTIVVDAISLCFVPLSRSEGQDVERRH